MHLSTIIRFKVPDILAPSNIQGFPCFFRTLEAVVALGTRNLRKGLTEEKSFVTDGACSVWTFANALVRRILQGGVLGRAWNGELLDRSAKEPLHDHRGKELQRKAKKSPRVPKQG